MGIPEVEEDEIGRRGGGGGERMKEGKKKEKMCSALTVDTCMMVTGFISQLHTYCTYINTYVCRHYENFEKGTSLQPQPSVK